MQLHPGREKKNAVTSGARKGKCSFIRGEEIEMLLHPGSGKSNVATSGEIKGKCSYIRGEKREMQLRPENGNTVTSRETEIERDEKGVQQDGDSVDKERKTERQ